MANTDLTTLLNLLQDNSNGEISGADVQVITTELWNNSIIDGAIDGNIAVFGTDIYSNSGIIIDSGLSFSELPVSQAVTTALESKIELPAGGTIGQILVYGGSGQGFTWSSITNGQDGAKGDKGDKGDTGDTGQDGQDGQDGPQGERGITGQDGIQGPQGPQGPQGDPAATVPATGSVIGGVKIQDDLGVASNLLTLDSAVTGKVLENGILNEWYGDDFTNNPSEFDFVDAEGAKQIVAFGFYTRIGNHYKIKGNVFFAEDSNNLSSNVEISSPKVRLNLVPFALYGLPLPDVNYQIPTQLNSFISSDDFPLYSVSAVPIGEDGSATITVDSETSNRFRVDFQIGGDANGFSFELDFSKSND